MADGLLSALPRNGLDIALVLALAFFIGLEREEAKQRDATYAFGGVRSFPLIGLVSYALALIAAPLLITWEIGFAVIAGFMALSYHHKLGRDPSAGLATEISALATYVMGGLVQHQHYWIATTLGVLSVLLLELKKGLEGLTKRVASSEIITVAKFLVLSVVILPIVPNRELTRFHINPFNTWLVVVAVSGVSFASYVLKRLLAQRGGVMLSAILGGAYSSTVTTVVLARQAKEEQLPNLFAGSILTASSMMYLRLAILLVFFNLQLAAELAPAFGALGALGASAGWMVSRRTEGPGVSPPRALEAKNPLELRAAFLFALVFLVVLVLTTVAREFLGRTGLYVLAVIMGVTDVDPFILGLAQRGAAAAPLALAAGGIVIAAASNNVAKAFYAYGLADRTTGRRSVAMLVALALLGLVPLVWV